MKKTNRDRNCSEAYDATIDLILPAFNPHSNWEREVVANFDCLKNRLQKYRFNLHIASDGSTRGYDGNVVAFLKNRIPSISFVNYEKNMGKGYALRMAVMQSMADFVVYIDYDFPYTCQSIISVIESLADGANVVVAARGKSYISGLPLKRKLLSRMSHIVNRYLFGLKIIDTQGGMKGFDRKGRDIFLSTTINTFLFDTQFICKAERTDGIKIAVVDAEIKNGLKMSTMSLKTILNELKNIFIIINEK